MCLHEVAYYAFLAFFHLLFACLHFSYHLANDACFCFCDCGGPCTITAVCFLLFLTLARIRVEWLRYGVGAGISIVHLPCSIICVLGGNMLSGIRILAWHVAVGT